MSDKNNFINLNIRKHSYGGTIDSILKTVLLASYFKKKIRVIDSNVNPKIKGGYFIRNINDKDGYKNLYYQKQNFLKKDLITYIQKLLLIIRVCCAKFSIFAFFLKVFFIITNINYKKAKIKFSEFFKNVDYFDANLNGNNLNYLKSIGLDIEPGLIQKIYIQRKSFDILNEEEEKIKIEKKKIFDFKRSFFCFYLREKNYNLKFPYLKKNNNVIWYQKEDFDFALNHLIDSNLFAVNIGVNQYTNKFRPQSYLNLNLENLVSEKINYIFAKNCKFFLSTGGGKSELAKLFNKPVLKIDHEYNVINNFDSSTDIDHVIFCHVYSKRTKKFLSITEQFKLLNKLFPMLSKGKPTFNYDDFLLVKNTKREIFELTKNFTLDKNMIQKHKINQKEVFEIKNYFVKKYMPEYFLKLSCDYPENPLICKEFFSNNYSYSEYLEQKTEEFNSFSLKQRS